jgi:hypothetical protein
MNAVGEGPCLIEPRFNVNIGIGIGVGIGIGIDIDIDIDINERAPWAALRTAAPSPSLRP